MFIKDMYRDEIRDGWLVKSEIKKAWNRHLEIWQEVDRICRKHGITYWAACGTLLGAVRHKGFIPWDKDFDLFMMRPDFNRFADVLKNELGEKFAVNFKDFSTIKIAHTQTTLIAPAFSENRPPGLMIDIFSLDIIDEGTRESFIAFNALREIFLTTFDYPKITRHLEYGGCILNDLTFLKNIADMPDIEDRYKIACLYANELFNQSSLVVWINDFFIKGYKYPMKKIWFDETIYLPFETVELPVPKNFDEVLTSYYGDWHTPAVYGQEKLGILYSADIPYKEFLRLVDVRKVLDDYITRHNA